MSLITEFLARRFPQNDDYAQHLGKLLSTYEDSGLAPPNLVSEVVSGCDGKLWAHVWEAMLYRYLLNLGFEPQTAGVTKSGQRGPDFGIMHQGLRIWIEAVTPSPTGIPLDYVARPKKGEVEFRPMPQEQRLLRWTSVLRDKRDKLEYYRTRNIINATDCTVIAVNSCRLQDYAINDLGSSRLPFAVEAVFPIGSIAFPINPDGKPDGEPANVGQPSAAAFGQIHCLTKRPISWTNCSHNLNGTSSTVPKDHGAVMAPKYDDHLPLYRQAEIFAGAGVSLEDLDPVRLGRGDRGDAAAAGRRPRYRRPGQRHHYMRSTPRATPTSIFRA